MRMHFSPSGVYTKSPFLGSLSGIRIYHQSFNRSSRLELLQGRIDWIDLSCTMEKASMHLDDDLVPGGFNMPRVLEVRFICRLLPLGFARTVAN